MILIICHAQKLLTIQLDETIDYSRPTMSSSQLYILKNKSFQANVLKIGRTKNGPDTRAKQIYTGATGVPEPFDVLFACSVADCQAAESKAHRRLAAYRVNDSREFFRISADIARKIVLDVCAEVNAEHQCAPPTVTVDWITRQKPRTVAIDRYEEKYGEVHELPYDSIVSSSLGKSKLSDLQKQRIDVVSAVLAEVYSDPDETWHDSFSRDQNPEPEIRIWEHIAKAYLKIDDIDYLSKEAKHEAYRILLHRSMAPSERVLRRTNLRHLTKQAAINIMAGYELAPKPLTVMKIKAQKEEDEVRVIHPRPIIAAIQNMFAPKHPRKPG
jgi:hypothetical protein